MFKVFERIKIKLNFRYGIGGTVKKEKCIKCGESLIPKRNFCPNCGQARKEWLEEKRSMPYSEIHVGQHKKDVEKILESAGIKTAAEKTKFLGELEAGVKPRDQVVKSGNVGRIGIK